jgi:hypothetical protein
VDVVGRDNPLDLWTEFLQRSLMSDYPLILSNDERTLFLLEEQPPFGGHPFVFPAFAV